MKSNIDKFNEMLAASEARKSIPMSEWSEQDFVAAEQLNLMKRTLSAKELGQFGLQVESIEGQQTHDNVFDIPYISGESADDRRKRILLHRRNLDLETAQRFELEHNKARGEIIARQNNTGCCTKITDAFFGR